MNVLKRLQALVTPAAKANPAEYFSRLREGEALLVDVREPAEWAGGVAQSAALLPLSDLQGPRWRWNPFLAEVGGRQVLVYCAAGGRARIAASILAGEGVHVANAGSIGDWQSAGWPIEPAPAAGT